jgi:SAM-dependent methyltransferase
VAEVARRYGRVFDEIAEEYDRHRPAYPEALIDRACEAAGLAPGARVLEIGCGTGQLTRSLLARGLGVAAVEPGEQLIARARDHLAGAGEVQFVNARLEEASLPRAHYHAVFSASAIHWIDPDVSWGQIADALVDGGTIALVSYFGLEDPRSASEQQALRASLARIAPELAAEWPSYRDLEATLQGAAQRLSNVSEAWAWLGSYEVARADVFDLFEDAQLAAVPILVEQTADALNAVWAPCPSRRACRRGSAMLFAPRTTPSTGGSAGRSARTSWPAC